MPPNDHYVIEQQDDIESEISSEADALFNNGPGESDRDRDTAHEPAGTPDVHPILGDAISSAASTNSDVIIHGPSSESADSSKNKLVAPREDEQIPGVKADPSAIDSKYGIIYLRTAAESIRFASDLRSRLSQSDLVYWTDGAYFDNSRTYQGLGTSTVVFEQSPGIWMCSAIHGKMRTSNDAEMAGIANALNVATKRVQKMHSLSRPDRVHIFSDAGIPLAVLAGKARMPSLDSTLPILEAQSNALRLAGVQICIHLVKGHSGVIGNEVANYAASRSILSVKAATIRRIKDAPVESSEAFLQALSNATEPVRLDMYKPVRDRRKITRELDRLMQVCNERRRRVLLALSSDASRAKSVHRVHATEQGQTSELSAVRNVESLQLSNFNRRRRRCLQRMDRASKKTKYGLVAHVQRDCPDEAAWLFLKGIPSSELVYSTAVGHTAGGDLLATVVCRSSGAWRRNSIAATFSSTDTAALGALVRALQLAIVSLKSLEQTERPKDVRVFTRHEPLIECLLGGRNEYPASAVLPILASKVECLRQLGTQVFIAYADHAISPLENEVATRASALAIDEAISKSLPRIRDEPAHVQNDFDGALNQDFESQDMGDLITLVEVRELRKGLAHENIMLRDERARQKSTLDHELSAKEMDVFAQWQAETGSPIDWRTHWFQHETASARPS